MPRGGGGRRGGGARSGGFRSGGFRSGGFRSGGFRSGGFRSGGFRGAPTRFHTGTVRPSGRPFGRTGAHRIVARSPTGPYRHIYYHPHRYYYRPWWWYRRPWYYRWWWYSHWWAGHYFRPWYYSPLYIIGGIAFAIISLLILLPITGITSNKTWFNIQPILIIILLMVFILIIFAVISRRGQKKVKSLPTIEPSKFSTPEAEAKEKGEENLRCLRCGAIYSPDAKFCPQCGGKIDGRQLGTISMVTPAGSKNCSYCGSELSEKDNFCKWCGTKVENK